MFGEKVRGLATTAVVRSTEKRTLQSGLALTKRKKAWLIASLPRGEDKQTTSPNSNDLRARK